MNNNGVNRYTVNTGGRSLDAGGAITADLALADALMLGRYSQFPLTDPNGGRRISVGQVWLERMGDAGWMPLIYTSNTGRPPPASDAPSTLSIWIQKIPGWAWLAAAAGAAYYLLGRPDRTH
jgi:hypothetical protein